MCKHIQPPTEFLQFGGVNNTGNHQQVLSFGATPPDPTRVGPLNAFSDESVDGDISSLFIGAGTDNYEPKHGWGIKPSMQVDPDAQYYEG